MTEQLLEQEIARVRKLSRAEAAFAAVAGRRTNPWSGSTAVLASLEKKLEQTRLEAEGAQLLIAMDQLGAGESSVARMSRECTMAASAVEEAERHPTIIRWRKARDFAARSGVGHGFGTWATWFESADNSTGVRHPQTYPHKNWPQELQFDDNARDVIRAWAVARDHALRAANEMQAASERRESLLRSHPELVGITLPKREKALA